MSSFEIYLIKGKIVDVVADAVVSLDNAEGEMASSSAMALRDRGGRDIEDESMSQPRELGIAWITDGGRLFAPKVIHLGVLDDAGNTTPEIIQSAIKSCIQRARDEGIETLALPPIGYQRGLTTPEQAVEALVEGLLQVHNAPEIHIAIVIQGDDEFQRFRAPFEQAVTEQAVTPPVR